MFGGLYCCFYQKLYGGLFEICGEVFGFCVGFMCQQCCCFEVVEVEIEGFLIFEWFFEGYGVGVVFFGCFVDGWVVGVVQVVQLCYFVECFVCCVVYGGVDELVVVFVGYIEEVGVFV